MSVSFNKSGIVLASGDEAGENMLLKTNQGVTYWNWGGNGGTRTLTATSDGGVRMESTAAANSGSWSVVVYQDGNIRKILAPSTQYTLSFDALFPAAGGINCSIRDGNALNVMTNTVTVNAVANKWMHYYCTLTTIDSLTLSSQEIYLAVANVMPATSVGVVAEFKNLKLELGSSPTPWIPNPADYGEVPVLHGFAEQGSQMSVYPNRIQTTEFVEW